MWRAPFFCQSPCSVAAQQAAQRQRQRLQAVALNLQRHWPLARKGKAPTSATLVFHERSADCAVYDNSYTSSVEDEQRDQGFEGAVSIASDDNGCTITANGIPNHNFNDSSADFHDPVKENTASYHVTRTPAIAAKTTALSQRVNNGVMLNGVVLDILSAGCYRPDGRRADANGNVMIGCKANDAWLLDPLSTANSYGADEHNAHTQPNGLYHYHGNPNALFDDNPGPAGSPLVGFAADGFPIYGSYFLDPASGSVRKAISGYALKSGTRGSKSDTNPGGSYDGTYTDDWQFTGAGDLDACNGMLVDGQYGYYVTDTYPWVIKCFTGTPDTSFEKSVDSQHKASDQLAQDRQSKKGFVLNPSVIASDPQS